MSGTEFYLKKGTEVILNKSGNPKSPRYFKKSCSEKYGKPDNDIK